MKVTNFYKGGSTMNLPNTITLIRIILIPIYLVVFFSNMKNKLLIAGIVFLLAGISDVLDGYIARKYELTTDLGAILDPFADKMMSFAVLISFFSVGLIPIWVLLALGIKEVIMIVGSGFLYLYYENVVVPANKYGKIATISFYVAIISILIKISPIISKILLIGTVIINMVAFLNYFIIFIDVGKDNKVKAVDK